MSNQINAAITSGTSPGVSAGCRIHLLGPGAVGRALLHRIANSRHKLVAATDSTGTIISGRGLDASDVAKWKRARQSFSQHAEYSHVAWRDASDRVNADIVIDATSSVARDGWSDALDTGVLQAGRCLVLVAKTSLAERASEWLNDTTTIACNAVLGGTGAAFLRELPTLRGKCDGVAIVGNASTTTIISAIERGGTIDDGIREAARLGYLETDPETDLRGTDAAVKLAIVAGAVRGQNYNASDIPCEDVRSLDPFLIRNRARSGHTTRLVARLQNDGTPNVAYEAVPFDSVLAPPCGRVVYQYDVSGGDRRILIGSGLGAEDTAAAAWSDVQLLARRVESTRARREAYVYAGGAI